MRRSPRAAPGSQSRPSSGERPLSSSTATLTTGVVICAYTEARWPRLVQAVESVCAQSHPATEVVLVVDHDRALLERARARFPQVRVVASTGAPGLSGARNTGVRNAATDIVAFLDDDASAAPDWLHELLVQFDAPDVAGVGGATAPCWPTGARPVWLPEEFDWTVGCSYRGLPGHGAALRNPIGANMAFRRDDVLAAGGFREGLGRVGASPEGGEETELAIRIRQRRPATRIVHSTRARVVHTVAPGRLSRRYFLARCWAEGRSKATIEARVGRRAALASERRYIVHTLPAGLARGLTDACRGQVAGGLGRAVAIALGLSVTIGGYLTARGSHRAHAAVA